MSRFLSVSLIAAVSLSLFAAGTASADDCAGWFCGDAAPKLPMPLPIPAPGGSIPTPPGELKAGDPTTLSLPMGEVLKGFLHEMVPGDHVTLKLPSGELKTFTWSDFLKFHIAGSITIGGGTTVITPAVGEPPSPPPAPTYIAPPSDGGGYGLTYIRPHAFRPRWSLGVSAGFIKPDGDSSLANGFPMAESVGSGATIEMNIGYRVGRHWMPYGFYEHGTFKSVSTTDERVGSNTFGFGLNFNSNPHSLGLVADIAFGVRMLDVPYAPTSFLGGGAPQNSVGTYTYSGGMMRLGVGISGALSPRFRLELMATTTVGSFSRVVDSNGSCLGSTDCESISAEDRSTYVMSGLTLTSRFDL